MENNNTNLPESPESSKKQKFWDKWLDLWHRYVDIYLTSLSEEQVNVLKDFKKEMHGAFQDCHRIKAAGIDVNYYLDLVRHRRSKNNVCIKTQFTLPDRNKFPARKNKTIESCNLNATYQIPSDKYTECIGCILNINREINVFNNNQCSYREVANNVTLIMIGTDINDYKVSGEETYCCPNCGAVSTLETLLDCCPYCGTHFIMTDLYPKITNFIFMIHMPLSRLSKFLYNVLKIASVVGFFIFTSLFDTHPFSAFMLCILSACTLMYGLVMPGQDLQNNKSDRKRCTVRRKLNNYIKPHSQEFSAAHFFYKMIAYLKIILFADNIENLVFYQGEKIKPFSNIINSDFALKYQVVKKRIKKNFCYLTIDIHMSDLYLINGRVEHKTDVFRMEVCKDLSIPEDFGFSMHRVKCHNCGGSFNATQEKHCPYCGEKYDIKKDDWVVLDVKRI